MADIRKDDVLTYVRKLIAKEFPLKENGEKNLSENRTLNTDERRNGQHRFFMNGRMRQDTEDLR
jgi:hypothetical protein